MFTALLYIGDCLYETRAIPVVRDNIAINLAHEISLTPNDPESFDRVSTRNQIPICTMTFRIDRESQKESRVIPYRFDGATGTLRVREFEFYEVLPEVLDEPTESVNLDGLKAKVKSGADLKKMLLNYYAT